MSQDSGFTGTYNLNGGLLNFGGLYSGGGNSIFNFGGGTITTTGGSLASPYSYAYVNMTLTGSHGKATIDSDGGFVGLYGNVDGPGSLDIVEVGNCNAARAPTRFSGGLLATGGTTMLEGASALLAGSSMTIGNGAGPGAVFSPPSIASGHAVNANLTPQCRNLGRFCYLPLDRPCCWSLEVEANGNVTPNLQSALRDGPCAARGSVQDAFAISPQEDGNMSQISCIC